MFHYICLAPRQSLNTCMHVHAGACFIIMHENFNHWLACQISSNWWLLPSITRQIAVLREGSCPEARQVTMVIKAHAQLTYRLTGIWQWRERVWSEETHAYESKWVSYELSHQTQLTNLGCNHCVHHVACCVCHVSNMEACRGEGVSQLFLQRQTTSSTAEDSCMGQHC